MALKRIRQKIDKVDREILRLLDIRMNLALEARSFKNRIKDPDREKKIIDELKKRAAAYPLLRVDFVLEIFKDILRESRRLQKTQRIQEKREDRP